MTDSELRRTRFTGQGPTCVSARCGSAAGRTKPPPMGEVPSEARRRGPQSDSPLSHGLTAVPAPPEGEPNTVHPISPGRGRPMCRPAVGPRPGRTHRCAPTRGNRFRRENDTGGFGTRPYGEAPVGVVCSPISRSVIPRRPQAAVGIRSPFLRWGTHPKGTQIAASLRSSQ